MIRIVYKVTAKEGCEQEFKSLAMDVLVPEAKKMPGCHLFSFFQNTATPCEFIFYEQWQTHNDVDAYKQGLVTLLGAPHPGEEFPAKMNDLIEADEDIV